MECPPASVPLKLTARCWIWNMTQTCVALFTYNRPRHTVRTLRALRANDGAAETSLIAFSDGPKTSADLQYVEAVRAVLSSIEGFRDVTVVANQDNKGLANSIIKGVMQLTNDYGRVIVLEDDMVTSPHFLRYMNQALDFYEREEQVISVHGYVYPVEGTLPETFFLRGADCWGWGTWKRGWDLFERDGAKLVAEIQRRGLVRDFNRNNSYPFFQMLQDQVAGKVDSWAIRWHASAFLREKLTLYPGRSLLQNIGIDLAGSNVSVPTNAFDVELSNTPINIKSIPIEENRVAAIAFERFFRALPYKRAHSFARRILSRFTGTRRA